MTTAEELFTRAQTLLGEGRLMSAVESIEKGRRLTSDPDLLTFGAYNLGVTHWTRLGNGDAARREFNEVAAVFDKYGPAKISAPLRGMLPKALDNALLLALSYEEFEALASRVKALTPDAPTVTQLAPETLKALDEGQPWSDQLFKIARGYYDRNDPGQDPGRYGEGRSTYQLLLDHRRELRLSRDRWRLAVQELSALSLRMAADCMSSNGGYHGAYSPEDFLPILADAVPFLDEYLAKNPGDSDLEGVRRNVNSFLVDVRERWAKQEATPGGAEAAALDAKVASLNDEGLRFLNRHEFDAALAKFREAEKICRKSGDQGKLQTCIGNIALVAANTGDPYGALKLLAEKEEICRTLDIPRGLANALATKAAILEQLHQTAEALAAAKEADETCRKNGLDDVGRKVKPLLERLHSRR